MGKKREEVKALLKSERVKVSKGLVAPAISVKSFIVYSAEMGFAGTYTTV